MFAGRTVAVVVPAYNEARLIERTVGSIPPWVDLVVVVDDASEDDTSARAASAAGGRAIVVRHPENAGVGAAIATGYRVAFEQGADVAAVMAGDAQMHPDDLPALLLPVVHGEVDYAKGDRLAHPTVREGMPRVRRLGCIVLSVLTSLAIGRAVRDSQCGYTALSRRAAEELDLDRLWPRYGYPNDLLAAVVRAGLRARDVVVRPLYGDEESGLGAWDALVVIPFLLARIVFRRAAAALGRTPLPRPAETEEQAGT
jgi:glycosyltransferase involved in cell wall biosynthesis